MSKTMCALVMVWALSGCSESVIDDAGAPPSDAGGDVDAGVSDVDAGSTDTDAGPGDDAGSTPVDGGGTTGLTGLVINEIDANTEATELYNTTSAPIDVSGYRITDDDMGMPDMGHLVAFPAGTTIASGGYLVAVQGSMPGTIQTGADCDAGDPCFHTDFGLSASAGDVIYVMGPEGDDTVYLTQPHPAGAVPDMQSYCRLPNGTGDFTACAPTPGEANAAP